MKSDKTTTTTTDNNGTRVLRHIRKEGDAWGVNVGWGSGCLTEVRRYYYARKADAQEADISDEIGKNGRIK